MKLALSTNFFTAFAKLPKKLFNKTTNLVNMLKKDPNYVNSKGANLEKLKATDDLYSIRVDDTYRCILKKPAGGTVFILLWVDHHDKAYQWANSHRCNIHPETGSVQIVSTIHLDDAAKEQEAAPQKEALFYKYRDRELLRLGVPEELIARVKTIASEEELDLMSDILPEEAYEGLFYLYSGESLADIYSYLATLDSSKTEVDIEDFSVALENGCSKRRFYVVEEDDDLISMLNAPLEKWRVFLHPTQRKLVEKNWNGPVRVLGGAGTGKTVAAIHRAKWLAKQLDKDSTKILFTTFTKNLAIDIEENLRKICSDKTMQNIEVKNLDGWVYEFLYQQGYKERIVYGNVTRDIWKEALLLKPTELNLPDSFFSEEYARVVQPQNVSKLNDYLRAKRIGRGTRLTKEQRRAVWPVFEEYRLLMSKNNYKEPADAMRDARILLEAGKAKCKYSHIIVDESQDITSQGFKLIRTMVPEGPNDIFIVGDAHQRIYGHKVVLGQCGIKIVGRGRKLKLNYRTTDEVRKFAMGIFLDKKVDDLDDGEDDNKGYKSIFHGPSPEIINCTDLYDEAAQIEKRISLLRRNDPETQICIALRTNRLLTNYQELLNKKGIETTILSNEQSDIANSKAIRLGTMHRVKGLEFDHMIIASANQGTIPLTRATQSDEKLIASENLIKERCLLFVAITRAKKSLTITTYGKPSPFLPLH